MPHDNAHHPVNAGRFIQSDKSGDIFLMREPVFENKILKIITLQEL